MHQSSDTNINKCKHIQINTNALKHTNTQTYKHTNIQTHKHTNMHTLPLQPTEYWDMTGFEDSGG